MKKNLWSRVILGGLLLVGLGVPGFLQAGYKPGPGWPEVTTPFFQPVLPADVGMRIASWRIQPGFVVRRYKDTGSMRPVLFGSNVLLAMEYCRPQTPLVPGMMVQFNRGDYPAVLHYIGAVSLDGQSVYMTGVSNRRSDGWFDRKCVAYVVREVITVPAPLITSLASR